MVMMLCREKTLLKSLLAQENNMSKAQKIDDHSFWAGGKSEGSVFPKGVHHKAESSAEGAGHEADYEDRSSDIKSQQVAGVAKAKAHPLKSGYRN